MRSECEIQAFRDNLQFCASRPCRCVRRGDFCPGLIMYEWTQRALSWALGESDELESIVAMIDRDAERLREELLPFQRCAVVHREFAQPLLF